ncbi:MAG TPA: endonuclease/exonuclease/phosphatase family protein [Ktedonobacterales bacterium]|jgi:hypothetical protein
MQFRFATWNLNSFRPLAGRIDLIRAVECDLLALQEVTEDSYCRLMDAGLFAWSTFSLSLRPPQAGEGPGRRLGCALFGKSSFRLVAPALLKEAPFPERTLAAHLESAAGPLTACSFHAPPGVNWGELKPQTFRAIAAWLARQEQALIFGMDANTPEVDHPDIDQNRWWYKDEAILLGSQAPHRLKDALRVYLHTHAEEMEQILTVRPEGPLAISYTRGKGKQLTPCRYDLISITPDIEVENIRYLYSEALRAGSDHALVVAGLRIG